MRIICDTHVLVFWADDPDKLGRAARAAVEQGVKDGILACSDVSLWEIAMLFAKGRLRRNADAVLYMNDIIEEMALDVLPVTPAIAVLSQSGIVPHGDPADRLIAATALQHKARLITKDEKLQAVPGLETIW
ncbi:MAG: type II toxin-antitoxin system VapC family toxin [Magnetococcales bacterium]|nr:type II toxin-antitoxin system VapC family toxin [Magnetococcales bacterium]